MGDQQGILNSQSEAVVEDPLKMNDVETSKNRSLSQVLSVFVAGVALFSDGYNIQIAGYMIPVLTKIYGPSVVTTSMKTRLSNSILIGDIVGMILFGFCIDRFGRRLGIMATTFLLVFGIILATAAHGVTPTGLLWMMVVGRGVAGVGAGGEYTVCTAQALEAADEDKYVQQHRGFLVAFSTNVAITSGFVGSSIASVVILAIAHDEARDIVWRCAFGIGIILPLTIFIFRMRLVNSTQYTKHAIHRNLPYKLAIKRYWKPLLGCCGAWFLYDFIVYPFTLLVPEVVSGFSSSNGLLETTGWSALVNAFSLPGAFFGGFLIDRIGRRQSCALGFLIVAVLAFIIGGAMGPLRAHFAAFVLMYGLFHSFLSVGPGNCTFLLASESFPTPIRGHFFGVAAGVGKAGAALGTQVFPQILARYASALEGQQAIFLIGASLAVAGAAVVWLLVPDRERQLECEDALFRAYLEENGWDVSDMGVRHGRVGERDEKHENGP
ncbi:major facilitator superfamily domain-containing protein [Mycena rosella]|uniref:Major facilitator superfamily domain-containing protein n=1 Tax=Mycena rosella TaxID=1033263 RepID=A0AAD7G9N7_MYCRO|nr:major facilitator superfamily domain-containing protein [Mycena rosella]